MALSQDLMNSQLQNLGYTQMDFDRIALEIDRQAAQDAHDEYYSDLAAGVDVDVGEGLEEVVSVFGGVGDVGEKFCVVSKGIRGLDR